MISIFLTKEIQDLANDYADGLFLKRRTDFERPKDKLRKLYQQILLNKTLDRDYSRYVRNILLIYPFVNKISPFDAEKYELHKRIFGNLQVDLSKEIAINGKNKEFYKLISGAMRYDAVRDKEFLVYVKKMRIRTCVYCNINYAISFDDKNSIEAKFELDHFKPQSKFPYLCTNFFNLYPVCSNCNKAKLDRDTLFNLYIDNQDKVDLFKFSLEKNSIAKYLVSKNNEDLQIDFDYGDYDDHDDVFKIKSMYNSLKDAAEELVWKYKIYNPAYMKSLRDSFDKKFNYGISRLILGNYDNTEEIHKRPLSKFTQDIARQLGIIKK